MSDETTIPSRSISEFGFSRRAFMGGATTTVLAFVLEASSAPKFAPALASEPVGTPSGTTGFIGINTDNTVTIAFGGGEMGQGSMTGLAQCAAEELQVAWSKVATEAPAISQTYVTGGSSAIRTQLQSMRVIGAQARAVLVQAAANRWGVDPSTLTVTNGTIVNPAGGATLTYAEVAAAAGALTPPTNPPLLDQSKFKILGTKAQRIDIPSKTNGSAIYGIDVVVPGMVFASVKHAPTVGATLVGTPATPAGALAVVPLGNAVGVVAKDTWSAIQAARSINATWTTPANASQLNSANLLAQAQTLMASGTPGSPLTLNTGDANGAYAAAAHKVEATYQLPLVPHIYMEVCNCTASVTATSCEVWAPTQAPAWVAGTAAAITGLPLSSITVHPTLMGGGLGRKIDMDYVAQAITIAKVVGKPVKMVWSREEDMGHDQYRPSALIRVRLGLASDGTLSSYGVRHVSPSPLYQRGFMGATGNDNTDGAADVSYTASNALVEYVLQDTPIPVGFWRSVGVGMNCFAIESAIDEAAKAMGADPVTYRRLLLAGKTRELAVLNQAASMIGWTTAPASGVGRGIAFSNGFGSLAALAVEIKSTATSISVTKACVAVDVGFAVNPDQIEAQIQGGLIQGISAALWGQTTFTNGVASSRNFSNSRVLKMSEVPAITVGIIESGMNNLGGVGEVGVPLAAPAIANAYASLTGNRVRTLPFFPGAGMSDG